MKKIDENIYQPDDGYKYITNGDVWCNEIRIGHNDSVDNWSDTNEEPPEPTPSDPPTEFEQGYDTAVEDILT